MGRPGVTDDPELNAQRMAEWEAYREEYMSDPQHVHYVDQLQAKVRDILTDLEVCMVKRQKKKWWQWRS